jgi:hypothetical protein
VEVVTGDGPAAEVTVIEGAFNLPEPYRT